MLQHLRIIETQDGWTYADPTDPDNWIDDPCTFCGGESVPHTCIGDGTRHHHGKIHSPPGSGVGFWAVCANPDCLELARAAWSDYRSRG